MLFLIHAIDRPDHADVRAGARERHLEYVRSFAEHLLIGGPTVDEADERMTGTMLVVDFPDLAAARAFAAGDPYRAADLFETVTVSRWRQSLGAPLVP